MIVPDEQWDLDKQVNIYSQKENSNFRNLLVDLIFQKFNHLDSAFKYDNVVFITSINNI